MDWEEKIAAETCGWPQYIMAYVWPAVNHMKVSDGNITAAELEIMLEKGRKGRIDFYEAHTEGMSRGLWNYVSRTWAKKAGIGGCPRLCAAAWNP